MLYGKYLKRIIDIIISILCVPPFLILFLIIAPIILLEDKGPIFYLGKRIGQNGKIFKMIKFRSMYADAPDIRLADGSTYNGDDDPRVTPIGRFLRKTSLDETPQIFNVLAGSMSLVGPRPDTIFSQHRYPEEEKVFLRVKPGITGYSQAFFRNSVDGYQKEVNDVYYAEHVSFLFDIKIILKTVETVLLQRNIYKDQYNR